MHASQTRVSSIAHMAAWTFEVASANVKTLNVVGVARVRTLGLNAKSKMDILDGSFATVGAQESCVGGNSKCEHAQMCRQSF